MSSVERPSIDMFQPAYSVLKIFGIVRPTGGLRDSAMEWWNRFVLAMNVMSLVVLVSGVDFRTGNVELALESLTFALVCSPCIYMTFVCSLWKKEIFELFDSIIVLLAEIEDAFGLEAVKQMQRVCANVMWAHLALLSISIPPPFAIAYYNYYIGGVKDAAPYNIYTLFGRKENIHTNCFWQFCTFIGPIAGVVANRIVMASLAIASSGIIEKTRLRFEMISDENKTYLLPQAVKWHSGVIRFVKESNSILGSSFTVEFLFSNTYICNACFMLSKFGSQDDTVFYKSLAMVIGFSSLPIYFCMSGHKIASESDMLYTSIYQNYWYRLHPTDRKDMILPMMMAKAGISWNYKKIGQFDMRTYLFIVKQSYSFYALLRLVDSG